MLNLIPCSHFIFSGWAASKFEDWHWNLPYFSSMMAVSYYLCPQSLRVSSGSRICISNSGYRWDKHRKRILHLVCASTRQPEKDLCLESNVSFYLLCPCLNRPFMFLMASVEIGVGNVWFCGRFVTLIYLFIVCY